MAAANGQNHGTECSWRGLRVSRREAANASFPFDRALLSLGIITPNMSSQVTRTGRVLGPRWRLRGSVSFSERRFRSPTAATRQAFDRDSRNRCAKRCHRHPILRKRGQDTFDKVRIALFDEALQVMHLARRRASGVLERYRISIPKLRVTFECLPNRFHPLSIDAEIAVADARRGAKVDHVVRFVDPKFHVVDKAKDQAREFHM